jgi:hypothetical protein
VGEDDQNKHLDYNTLHFCDSRLKIHNILWFMKWILTPDVHFLFICRLPDGNFSFLLKTKEGRIFSFFPLDESI